MVKKTSFFNDPLFQLEMDKIDAQLEAQYWKIRDNQERYTGGY